MEPPRASISSANPRRPSISSPMGPLPHDFFNHWSGSQWAWSHQSFIESETQPPKLQDLNMQMFFNPPLPIEQLLLNEGQNNQMRNRLAHNTTPSNKELVMFVGV